MIWSIVNNQSEISNINIQFIHKRGKIPSSTLIILTYRWPDSLLRYTKHIPLLTDSEQYGRLSMLLFLHFQASVFPVLQQLLDK